MIRRWFIEGLSVVLVAVIATSAAAEGGWKIPNLLPFPSKKPKTSRDYVRSKSGRAGSVSPASYTPRELREMTRRRRKPSNPMEQIVEGTKQIQEQTTRTVSNSVKKIGDGTKELFDHSKQLLMPWAGDGKTSSRRAKPSRTTTQRDNKGTGFFTAPKFWTTGDKHKKSKPPLTMSEWIGQDRPGQ
jgi:hypothetical protein